MRFHCNEGEKNGHNGHHERAGAHDDGEEEVEVEEEKVKLKRKEE